MSDPCMTIEEAEKVKTDWDLMKDLEMESLGVVADWAEKKAEALGRPRKEILAIVGDWRIGDNGTGDL